MLPTQILHLLSSSFHGTILLPTNAHFCAQSDFFNTFIVWITFFPLWLPQLCRSQLFLKISISTTALFFRAGQASCSQRCCEHLCQNLYGGTFPLFILTGHLQISTYLLCSLIRYCSLMCNLTSSPPRVLEANRLTALTVDFVNHL